MKKAISIALAVFLVLPALVLASGSSGGGGAPSGASGSRVDPYKVTETLKCVVTKIYEDGTVMVRDTKTEREQVLAVNYKTKITAQDKNEFDGRKKLAASDFKIGQELRVTHRPATHEVLAVKILNKKA